MSPRSLLAQPDESPIATMWNGFSLDESALLYLVLAGVCLMIALRYLRRALQPVGPLVQAFAATAVVAFAIGIALVLIVAAAFHSH